MNTRTRSPETLAFSPSVRAVQERKGSRRAYADAQWRVEIDAELEAFIGAQRSFFLASASGDGQPYIQHRGGQPGFLRVLDRNTLGFADYRGNRQFITTGNLAENDRVQLFLMDYAHQRRVKIWGRARVIENDPALVARLMPDGARARADQAIIISVEAWDVNCPQHIPQRFEAEDVARAIDEREARIRALETELAVLQQQRAVRGDDPR